MWQVSMSVLKVCSIAEVWVPSTIAGHNRLPLLTLTYGFDVQQPHMPCTVSNKLALLSCAALVELQGKHLPLLFRQSCGCKL